MRPFGFLLIPLAVIGSEQIVPLCVPNGESGDSPFHVAVLTEPQIVVEMAENGSWPMQSALSVDTFRCSLRLESCSFCSIGIEFEPVSAHFTEYQIDRISKCDDLGSPLVRSCFDLEFVEESAEQSGFSTSGIGDAFRRQSIWSIGSDHFNSSGNSVIIRSTMRGIEDDPHLFRFLLRLFPLRLRISQNTVIIKGKGTERGFVESSRFPFPYPRSLQQNFTFISENNGSIRLIFDDFFLNYRSDLKIVDWNGRVLFWSRDSHRRPPAVQSAGFRLSVLFSANGFTQRIGFRIRYQFVEKKELKERPSAIDCDEYTESVGGRLVLGIRPFLVGEHVDCLWMFSRNSFPSRNFDRLFLRVENFDRNSSLRIDIRRGMVSTAESSLMLSSRSSLLINSLESEDSFYVRISGLVSENDLKLNFVFSHFYRWATAACVGGGAEFHCDNSKCIPNSLHCDGWDHCGDGSDEKCRAVPSIAQTENFTFPSILWISAILSAVLFLVALAVLLVMLRRRLFIFRRRSSAPTSSMAASVHTADGEPQFYRISQTSEAPPSYSDALKYPSISASVSSYTNASFNQTTLNENVPQNE